MATQPAITGAQTRAPSNVAPTRRNLLAAIAAAPVVALPGAAARPATDARLEQLFSTWKSALWEINHSPDDVDAEDELWERLNEAEDEIICAPVASPRVAAIRIWIALEHQLTAEGEGDAIAREDVADLIRRSERFDWEIRCQVQALCALTGFAGVR